MRLIRRMIPVCAAVVMAVVASACNRSSQTMPREFGPLVLGSTASCPVVSGRYFESEGPINDLLFLSNVLDAPNDADRAWVELAGMADTGVAVTVMYRDSTVRYGSLRKGDQWSGDYFCEDGWLKVSDRRIPGRWDRDITDADFQPRRRAFWLAPNADGGLVGRLQFIAFDAIDSWCPSGCEGIPIPGTFQYRDAWSLAERFDPGLPPPVARKREADRQRVLADFARARRDPVYQEEQLLENGPPDPERDAVQRRALRSVVEGMLIKGVGRSQGGFNISLEFDELWQLEQFMTRFQGTGPVEEIAVAPLYRARTTDGHWTDVVWVRLSP
ncbi:hypothetical protein [Gemmatimonas sp.]